MMRAPNCILLTLAFAGLCRSAFSYFLDEPKVKWTYTLPGSGTFSEPGLRKDNEVLISKDEKHLFVTADDGKLHFIDPLNLRNSEVFEPYPIPGVFTECRSGVSIVEFDGEIEYVLYPVIDVPVTASVPYNGIENDPSRSATRSRLFAVNLDGSVRWTVHFNGAIVGKPIVGRRGNKIYVVHNVPNFIGSSPVRGKVSVILAGRSTPIVTASVAPTNRHGPFGPASGRSIVLNGQHRDAFVVAEAWENGYTGHGQVYMFMPSRLYDDFNGQGNDSYELRVISDWPFASVSRPAVSADATQIFVGGAGANMAGWTGEMNLTSVLKQTDENISPRWQQLLEPSKANASQPLLTGPVLSADESVLYVAGTSMELYCIESKTGQILWTNEDASGIQLAEPKLMQLRDISPKVYTIEALNGRIRQVDAVNGTADWVFDCHSETGIPCHDAVEADFSFSQTGNMLYYGDIFGKIVALQVAEFPTSSPTFAPTGPVASPETKVPATSPVTSSPVDSEGDSIDPGDVDQGDSGQGDSGQGDSVPTAGPVGPLYPQVSDGPLDTDDTVRGTTSLESAQNDDVLSLDYWTENLLLLVLGAACAGLIFLIVLLLLWRCCCRPRGKKSLGGTTADQDENDWQSYQNDYEESCRREEDEFNQSIAPKTPKTKSRTKSPLSTPSTLDSIQEGDCEHSFAESSAASSPIKTPTKLEKSFHEAEKSPVQTRSLIAPVVVPLPASKADVAEDPGIRLTAVAHNNSSVEVLEVERPSSPIYNDPSVYHPRVLPPSSNTNTEEMINTLSRPSSPLPPQVEAADDRPNSPLMITQTFSQDSSLYYDDDNVSTLEVLSLQSCTPTPGKEDEVLSKPQNDDFPLDEPGPTPVFQYRPPTQENNRQLAKPVAVHAPSVKPITSSNTASASISPRSAQTPAAFQEEARPHDESGLPLAFSGASARTRRATGSWDDSGRSARTKRSQAESKSSAKSNTDAASSTPDAWSSFLTELAKAEQEFFNPNFGKRARSPSPPPPPPPPSS